MRSKIDNLWNKYITSVPMGFEGPGSFSADPDSEQTMQDQGPTQESTPLSLGRECCPLNTSNLGTTWPKEGPWLHAHTQVSD